MSLTSTPDHICFFRHGLALDERRVKFLPEYFFKGLAPQFGTQSKSTEFTDVEEVWFAGSHSDMYVEDVPDGIEANSELSP